MYKADWIETASGKQFTPLAPRAEDICIEDIAHALSNLCRFGGHVAQFHSVAAHSLLVSRHCKPENALWGLLHDGSEAFLVDVPRPIKLDPFMGRYREAEAVLQAQICAKFGLLEVMPPDVHEADQRVLLAEKRDLMGGQQWDAKWVNGLTPIPTPIVSYSPSMAKYLFLQRFKELTQ